MSFPNALIYKEQGASTMVVKAADGAVIKGQASAAGTPAQAAHIAAISALTGGDAPSEAEANSIITALNAVVVALENAGILARS